MKKLLSVMLALAVSFSAAGSLALADEPVPTESQDIYGWTRIDSKNSDETLYDTVNIIEDETCGYAAEVIKQSPAESGSMLGIRQKVSPSKLISGHTYVLEFRYKMDNPDQGYWLQYGFDWSDASGKYHSDFKDPYSKEVGDKGWMDASVSIVYTSADFANGFNVKLYSANGAARFCCADVKLYDAADPDKTNLLVNGKFDSTIAEHSKDFLYGWSMTHSGLYYDETTKENLDTVSLYHNDPDGMGTVLLIDKKSESHSGSMEGVRSVVPADKLVSGKTYVMEYDMKTSNNAAYAMVGMSGSTWEPYGPNCTAWSHRSREVVYNSGELAVVFRCTGEPLKLYVANVTVYAKDDETKTNLLLNGDFSHLDSDHSDGLYSWSIEKIGSGGDNDTVNVIENAEFGTAAQLDKHSANNATLTIRNEIPAYKLLKDHVYVVEYSFLMEPRYSHYALNGWGGGTSNTEFYGPNCLSWTKKTNEAVYTGSGNMNVFFRLKGYAGKMWIADVKVYDKEDAAKTNLITNGNFTGTQEAGPDSSVEFSENGGVCTASVISKKEAYTAMMAYAVYAGDGRLVSIEAEMHDIEAKPEVQEFQITPPVLGQGYYTKVFLWNSETLMPLAEAIVME